MAEVTIKKAPKKLELMTESGHEKRAEVSIEGNSQMARSLFVWLFYLSAEKCINRKFFSCIEIIILKQLNTVFPFFFSSPPRVSLLVLARLRS